MKKSVLLLPLSVLLFACGNTSTPETSPAQTINNSEKIEAQGLLNCAVNVDQAHNSSTPSIKGAVKVNGKVICPAGTFPYTVEVQMFLQKRDAYGNWADVKPGQLVTKKVYGSPVTFFNDSANAFIPCVAGTYRGRLWVNRYGDLMHPVIDPVKNSIGAPRDVSC